MELYTPLKIRARVGPNPQESDHDLEAAAEGQEIRQRCCCHVDDSCQGSCL